MNAKTPDHLLENTTPKTKWKDPKRYLWMLSPALPAVGIAALTAYAIAPKKLRALAWVGPILVHGVIPALDRMIGEDQSNPPEEAVRDLEKDKYYDRVVKTFVPLQYGVTLLGAYLASRKSTPTSDYIGLTLSVGALNGIGINTAHELGHKQRHIHILRLSIILVIINVLPHQKTQPVAVWAKVFGSFCHVLSLVVLSRAYKLKPNV